MGYKIDPLLHKNLHNKDKVYGTATIGAKGQVVIPAEARKDLKLKPGDHLLVMGKLGKALGLIKAEELEALIGIVMENLSDKKMKNEFKDYANKILGNRLITGKTARK